MAQRYDIGPRLSNGREMPYQLDGNVLSDGPKCLSWMKMSQFCPIMTHSQGGQGAHPSGTPPAEINIDGELIHRLLTEQHPDLADLPLTFEQHGWDNVMFRLGHDMVIRLPRRQASAALIAREQKWLPSLSGHLPLPIPAPHRTGMPNKQYPWQWSILPWFPGIPADQHPPSIDQAPIFAAFLKALHRPAPPEAPVNPFRGIPLAERASALEERLKRVEAKTDLITQAIRQQWYKSIETPIDVDRTWIHGDLHSRNILVHEGKITAVIDWGDISMGDRATDLASIWMLFPDQAARQTVMAELPHILEPTWQRARGWAILFAVLLLDTGMINEPRHADIGRRTLQHLLEDLASPTGSGPI